MKIEFLPEAKYELDDAINFYELQVKGLGITFKSLSLGTSNNYLFIYPLLLLK